MSKTLWYSWSGAGLLQSFSLLWIRGCPSELSALPWSLQCSKGRCCSWQNQLIICYLPSEKAKEQSQLNRAVFESCPGVTVSVEQQVLLSCAGSVCFSNQIQTALWSLLEGKDGSRPRSLATSWNPAGTHNSLGLSSQVERCSLRTSQIPLLCDTLFIGTLTWCWSGSEELTWWWGRCVAKLWAFKSPQMPFFGVEEPN